MPADCSFFTVTRTPDELSIVTPTEHAPENARVESGFACVKIHGPLAFSETGIVANLTAPLARSGISVFVVSTFDTDYLFIKNIDLATALNLWTKEGHQCH